MKWFVKWMVNVGKDLNVQGRCDRPYRVKDNKVSQLNKKDMVCGKKLVLLHDFDSLFPKSAS